MLINIDKSETCYKCLSTMIVFYSKLFAFFAPSFPLHLHYAQHGTLAILEGHIVSRAHFSQLQRSDFGLLAPSSNSTSKKVLFHYIYIQLW